MKYIKKINLKKVEEFLEVKLQNNLISIGFDVSVHSTGIAIIRTTDEYLILEKVERIITPKNIEILSSLDSFISQLDNFKNNTIQKYKINITIIEDCFFGKNVVTLKALARHSALVYDRFRRVSDKLELLMPNVARKKVNFKKSKSAKGEQLKKEIINYVNKALEIDIKNSDESDSVVLALAGLLQ